MLRSCVHLYREHVSGPVLLPIQAQVRVWVSCADCILVAGESSALPRFRGSSVVANMRGK